MPNLWTNIRQQAYECLNGPRTKDYDFDKKLEELAQTKAKIILVRSSIVSFPSRTAGMLELCEDIIRNLPSAFIKDNSFYPFINDVACAHKAFQDAYLKCRSAMDQLHKDTQAWDKIFEGIESDVKQRNELRKVYDHYDDKLEELVKERNAKLVKNKTESAADIEKFERNEKKWREATSQYVNHANLTYKRMQDLLDSRYNLMVPVIMTFVTNERLFFINAAKIFNYFENCQGKWQQMTSAYRKQKIDYNALDFIRGKDLLTDNEVNKNRVTNLNTVTTGMIGGNMPPGSSKKPPSNMGGGGGGSGGGDNVVSNNPNANSNVNVNPNANLNHVQTNYYGETVQGNQVGYPQPQVQPQSMPMPQRMPMPMPMPNQGQGQGHGQGQNVSYQPPFNPNNMPQSNNNNHQSQFTPQPQQQQQQQQQFNQGQQKMNQSSFPQQPHPELFKFPGQYLPNANQNPNPNQINPYQPDTTTTQDPQSNSNNFNPYDDNQNDQ